MTQIVNLQAERERAQCLYVIGTVAEGEFLAPCKVGITNNWPARLKSVQTGSAQKVDYAFVFNMPARFMVRELESEIHHRLRDYRMTGEWFDINPWVAVQVACVSLQVLIQKKLNGMPADEKQRFYEATRCAEAMGFLSLPTEHDSIFWSERPCR